MKLYVGFWPELQKRASSLVYLRAHKTWLYKQCLGECDIPGMSLENMSIEEVGT